MNDEAKPDLDPIEKMIERLKVGAVFGEPITEGDVTVVPVADVRLGFGYGFGSGRGRDEESEGAPTTGEGSGSGGGVAGSPQRATSASLRKGSGSNRCRT